MQGDIIVIVYSSLCKVPIIFFQILNRRTFSLKVFEKYSNIKFHENPSSGSRVVPYGRTDKLIVDLSDFANALKNLVPVSQQECLYVIRTDHLMTVRGIITVYSYKT
jgi:hypothetical protein